MDGSYYCKNASVDPSVYLIMDNDSGYVSNNLDQESNSDSVLDSSDTSTVDILRSFLPKPIYLSEDALLECPVIGQNIDENTMIESHSNEMSDKNVEYSGDVVIDSSVRSEKTGLISNMPSFSSSRTDNEDSDLSVVIPVADAIYFDLKTRVHSSPTLSPNKLGTHNRENTVGSDSVQENFFNFNKTPIEKCDEYIDNSVFSEISNVNECIQEKDEGACSHITSPCKPQSNNNHVLNFNEDKESLIVTDALNRIPTSTSVMDENFSKEPIQATSSKLKSIVCTPKKVPLGNNSENNILSNVTNICDKTENLPKPVQTSSKIVVVPRRRSNSSRDKENITQPEVFKTPNKGIKRKFNESASPDLFSDDETSKPKASPSPRVLEERFIHKLDYRLLKRVQKELSGVPPPPDLTITNFTVDDILQKLEANKSYFWTKDNLSKTEEENSGKDVSLNGSKNSSFGNTGSILIEGNYEEETVKKFPEVLYLRYHGLHHNRNKLSEEIEHLCDKYAKRYIGAETQSTCTALDTKYMSPAKRRLSKQKLTTKSPGRRLSHLARRRITFSSANLQASSSSSAASRARQILIDYKKLELLNQKRSPRRSPRKTPRKTPNKSPVQGRTPSSSAKKKLRMRFRLLSGDFKEDQAGPSSIIAGSKRALFQSPNNENKFKNILSNSSTSSCSSFNSDLNSRGTKRSLFPSPNRIGCRSSLFPSPKKKSPFKSVSSFEKKRKRDEADDSVYNPSKLFRSQSIDVRSSDYEQKVNSSFSRARSDSVVSCSQPMADLSAAHKKKLQWAVYESLKLQNISTTHPQFKTFASVLARVTRRFILSSNIRLEGGTSERMLRIARHHSFAVVKGKSVEEIMREFNKSRAKTSKPHGYIAPENLQRSQTKESSMNKENALKDRSNTGDSLKSLNARSNIVKPESRIDRIRKVINFEDNR